MMDLTDGGVGSNDPKQEIGENGWIDFFSRKFFCFLIEKNFYRLGVVIIVIVIVVVVVVVVVVDVFEKRRDLGEYHELKS